MTVPFVIAVAVLLGLLLFVIQTVRRPGGDSRWKRRLRVGSRLVLLLLAFLVFWGFFIEPNRLIVRQESIEIAGWPRELVFVSRSCQTFMRELGLSTSANCG